MFTGFQLAVSNKSNFMEYKKIGDDLFNGQKRSVGAEIDKFLLGDGSINGAQIQSNWFPQIEADIFISHSHRDEELAIALAGWLKSKFDLTAFIDSCVWGYSNDLLKKIDNTYCKTADGAYYDYDKRNFSTSHVHMMLSMALTMMIDNTECVFFLDTPNSIKSSEVINQTLSPWIYYELGMTKLIRKKTPTRNILIKAADSLNEVFTESLQIRYDVKLDHLSILSQTDLENWVNVHHRNTIDHPLDQLYRLSEVPQR